MSFHFLSLFRKPAPVHAEPRYYAATKAENEAARAMAIHRRLELAVAVSSLTPEEARAARMRGMGGGR